MNLFRSDEHIARWLGSREPTLQASPEEPATRGQKLGVTIPVTTLAELAHAWWRDRLDPDWRPHTREQNQAILNQLGLKGPFWQLPS
jgi:hypothetical protein